MRLSCPQLHEDLRVAISPPIRCDLDHGVVLDYGRRSRLPTSYRWHDPWSFCERPWPHWSRELARLAGRESSRQSWLPPGDVGVPFLRALGLPIGSLLCGRASGAVIGSVLIRLADASRENAPEGSGWSSVSPSALGPPSSAAGEDHPAPPPPGSWEASRRSARRPAHTPGHGCLLTQYPQGERRLASSPTQIAGLTQVCVRDGEFSGPRGTEP